MNVARQTNVIFLSILQDRNRTVLSNVSQQLLRLSSYDLIGAKKCRKQRHNILLQRKDQLFNKRQKRTDPFVPPPTTPSISVKLQTPQSDSEKKDSFQISEKPDLQQEYSDEIPLQTLGNPLHQDDQYLDIPLPKSIKEKDHNHLVPPGEQDSFELQTLIQNNGPPLEAYADFSKRHVLNSQSRYETENPLKAVLFWLVDILYESRVKVVFDIKRSFIKGDFEYIMKIFEQAHILKQYGGEDINEDTIKKLFVQFIYKKEEESTIKFIEKYTILEAVIELAIVYYIICSSQPQIGQRFLKIYQDGCKEIQQFYEIIAHVFNMKLKFSNEKRFIFEGEDKHITVKIRSDGMLESWIM